MGLQPLSYKAVVELNIFWSKYTYKDFCPIGIQDRGTQHDDEGGRYNDS